MPATIDLTVSAQGLAEGQLANQRLMVESRGNTMSSHNIVRLSGARKFNQEDPIEAASAEMILQKN